MRGPRGVLALIGSAMVALGLIVPAGAGASGYVKTDSFPASTLPVGIAINQATGAVYEAQLITPPFSAGKVNVYTSTGTPLTSFGSRFFQSVAVSPNETVFAFSTSNFAGANPEVSTFSSLGTPGPTFPAGSAATGEFVPIAVDSSNNVYVSKNSELILQKYTSVGAAGSPATFDCSECSPAGFGRITGVAVDSAGNVYVVDRGAEETEESPAIPNRVVKFNSAGVFQSVLQSEEGAIAVAVDPATDEVFVGDMPATEAEEDTYHVVVYDSSGNEIADFGKGDIPNEAVGRIAVNSSTGDVYVIDSVSKEIVIFSPLAPPTPATTSASAIAQTTATLNGTVNPNGSEVSDCHFEYGPTESYGSEVPCLPAEVGSGESPVAVHADVSGLSANSGYHYRLVAEGPGGEAQGDDETFKTLPNKPLATTEAATGMTQSAATLHGTVDAEGDDAACKFEYGTTTGYGSVAPCSATPVTGTAPTAVSAALSGLAAGTTYHYRVVASNGGGATNGADGTFATATAPPPPPPSGGGGASTPPPAGGNTPPPVARKPLKCKKGFKKKTVKGKKKCVKVKKKQKRR